MDILILGLATWRIASLFADEEGPFDMFEYIRKFVGVKTDNLGNRYGTNVLSKGIICVWCNSIWFGTLIFGLWLLLKDNMVLACIPLALSTIAVIIDEVVSNGKS